MASLRVSVQSIKRAARAAGPAEEEVLRILFEDAGRPLPPKDPPPTEGPHSTYHKKNAAAEGVPAEPSDPVTTYEDTQPD